MEKNQGKLKTENEGNSGTTVMPSGFAESESKNNPPATAVIVTVGKPELKAAYTISGGKISICAPSRLRTLVNADSQNTARNATSKIKIELRVLMLWSPGPNIAANDEWSDEHAIRHSTFDIRSHHWHDRFRTLEFENWNLEFSWE